MPPLSDNPALPRPLPQANHKRTPNLPRLSRSHDEGLLALELTLSRAQRQLPKRQRPASMEGMQGGMRNSATHTHTSVITCAPVITLALSCDRHLTSTHLQGRHAPPRRSYKRDRNLTRRQRCDIIGIGALCGASLNGVETSRARALFARCNHRPLGVITGNCATRAREPTDHMPSNTAVGATLCPCNPPGKRTRAPPQAGRMGRRCGVRHFGGGPLRGPATSANATAATAKLHGKREGAGKAA